MVGKNNISTPPCVKRNSEHGRDENNAQMRLVLVGGAYWPSTRAGANESARSVRLRVPIRYLLCKSIGFIANQLISWARRADGASYNLLGVVGFVDVRQFRPTS